LRVEPTDSLGAEIGELDRLFGDDRIIRVV